VYVSCICAIRTSQIDKLHVAFSILKRHLEFLVDRHEYFSGLEVKPDNLGELFSDSWTQEAMENVVSSFAGDISQVSSSTPAYC